MQLTPRFSLDGEKDICQLPRRRQCRCPYEIIRRWGDHGGVSCVARDGVVIAPRDRSPGTEVPAKSESPPAWTEDLLAPNSRSPAALDRSERSYGLQPVIVWANSPFPLRLCASAGDFLFSSFASWRLPRNTRTFACFLCLVGGSAPCRHLAASREIFLYFRSASGRDSHQGMQSDGFSPT